MATTITDLSDLSDDLLGLLYTMANAMARSDDSMVPVADSFREEARRRDEVEREERRKYRELRCGHVSPLQMAGVV